METTVTEVAIIGAGPIGLELGVALKKLDVPYEQFDAGQIGQTISWYPRQVQFFSSPERIAIAGVPLNTSDQSKATREEYLAYLRGIVDQFGMKVRTFERVTNIEKQSDGRFMLTSESSGKQMLTLARYVVIAIGDMHHPRFLHIPGEDLAHVNHYFDEPHRYFQKKLLIVGGRNSAVEAAIRCQRAGAEVAISYRKGMFDEKSVKYWLLPEIKWLIKKGMIRYLPYTQPTRIDPGSVTFKRLGCDEAQKAELSETYGDVVDPGVGEPFDVDADFVLLLTGYAQDSTLFEAAGVELQGENRAPEHDQNTMQTNVPGLYVIGTAAAGTQIRFKSFIETSHVHVARVVEDITGKHIGDTGFRPYELPES